MIVYIISILYFIVHFFITFSLVKNNIFKSEAFDVNLDFVFETFLKYLLNPSIILVIYIIDITYFSKTKG